MTKNKRLEYSVFKHHGYGVIQSEDCTNRIVLRDRWMQMPAALFILKILLHLLFLRISSNGWWA